MTVRDTFDRPLGNLRLSVTDRCNLRCQYCMPEKEYVWLERRNILSLEEIDSLVGVFATLGVDRVRLTGGEPLLRRDLDSLVAMIAARAEIRDLAMTTNGVLLADQARGLRDAGLGRVTISLDTLHADRFEALTRRAELDLVLNGIATAQELGFENTKIDTVVMKGFNDDELVELLEYGRQVRAEVRFIEFMDVGGATGWSPDKVLSREEILRKIQDHYGPVVGLDERSNAPAERFRLEDGTVFGIIASTTAPFCGSCDRSRLTADGMWYLCLYARVGTDLRRELRGGASEEQIAGRIRSLWSGRTNRGAEERLAERDRSAWIGRGALRKDPHLEMHTRGG